MIRRATFDDLLDLVLLAEDFFRESKYTEEFGVTFDDTTAYLYLKFMVENPNSVVFVAEEDGEIVGLQVGQRYVWCMNRNELVAMSLYLYVMPKYRKKLHGLELVRAFDDWCRQSGCKAVQTGTTMSMNGSKVASIYKRAGFKEQGIDLVKRVEASHG